MNADVLSAYLGHFCSFAVLMVIVCPRTLSNLGKCNYQGIQTNKGNIGFRDASAANTTWFCNHKSADTSRFVFDFRYCMTLQLNCLFIALTMPI